MREDMLLKKAIIQICAQPKSNDEKLDEIIKLIEASNPPKIS